MHHPAKAEKVLELRFPRIDQCQIAETYLPLHWTKFTQRKNVANSLYSGRLAAAVPAGYIAAFPINAWLIGKELKRCH